jgi:type I restriction enzyme, S subunit
MSDRGKYKRALKGDIAYNIMRMRQEAVSVVPARNVHRLARA